MNLYSFRMAVATIVKTEDFQTPGLSCGPWLNIKDTYNRWVELRDKLGLTGDSADEALAYTLIDCW